MPTKTASKKAAAPEPAAEEAAPAAEAAHAASKAKKGYTRVYPTHRRQAGDLLVSHDDSGEPLVVTDEGADLPDALAQQLIDFREVTTDAPKAAKEDE
jgi:hypothetical protein